MLRRILILATAAALLSPLAAQPVADRWEKDIQAFEAAQAAIEPGGVVFIGSSSIRRWDIDKWFPELNAINLGYGGTATSDIIRHAPRILLPLEPRLVVIYVGDNDIGRGGSPDQVAADFQRLTGLIERELPSTKIIFISLKPSIARWDSWGKMQVANAKIRAICDADDSLVFADVGPPMLGANGEPKPELFVEDGLHLSDAGYDTWADVLKPLL